MDQTRARSNVKWKRKWSIPLVSVVVSLAGASLVRAGTTSYPGSMCIRWFPTPADTAETLGTDNSGAGFVDGGRFIACPVVDTTTTDAVAFQALSLIAETGAVGEVDCTARAVSDGDQMEAQASQSAALLANTPTQLHWSQLGGFVRGRAMIFCSYTQDGLIHEIRVSEP